MANKTNDTNFILSLIGVIITISVIAIGIGKYVQNTEVSQMQTTNNNGEIRSLIKSSGEIKTDVAVIKRDIKNINRSLEVLLQQQLVAIDKKNKIAKGD